jgi:hypothetical protein
MFVLSNVNGYNSVMFLVGILSWWYGNGWISRTQTIKDQLAASADLFSIGLLAKTIFAPFRQISAGETTGPISVIIHAFVDKLISRLVGAAVRLFMIMVGLLVMFFQIIFGVIVIIVWPILPFFLVIGLILMLIGWVPQWTI